MQIWNYLLLYLSHGTRCAGAAAANANNSVCGVGVAYDAQVAGIKILDGPITDLLEARALTYKAKDVHIRSASCNYQIRHFFYYRKLFSQKISQSKMDL